MNTLYRKMPMSTSPGSALLSVPEAARLLGISRTTVSRWIGAGKLPAYRVGPKNIRIKKEDLEKVVQPARPAQQKGGSTMERIQIKRASKEEITRRQALVQRILANRSRRGISPLTSADLVQKAREEEYSAYGKPRPTR